MIIRHTKPTEIDTLMTIYEHARQFMREHGNPKQWSAYGWPPRTLIERDIAEGHSYVCLHEDRIVGTFYYNYGKRIEPTYDIIENGAWIGDDGYGVVHRIAGDGSQKGIGTFCLNWAYAQCGHLRIDTHEDNYVMQNLLAKLGFTYCGHIHVKQDIDIRLAYEKC